MTISCTQTLCVTALRLSRNPAALALRYLFVLLWCGSLMSVKRLTETERDKLAKPEQWALARKTYNALTLALSQLTGYGRHTIYPRIDEKHELALLNTTTTAMRLGASVYQVAAVFVMAWKKNERRCIDVPPLAWFTSTNVSTHFKKEAKKFRFAYGVKVSRAAAVSLIFQMEARKAGLFRVHALPYQKSQKDLDTYAQDCGKARVLCDAKEQTIRPTRIGYLFR